jgi:hypothetical protein
VQKPLWLRTLIGARNESCSPGSPALLAFLAFMAFIIWPWDLTLAAEGRAAL